MNKKLYLFFMCLIIMLTNVIFPNVTFSKPDEKNITDSAKDLVDSVKELVETIPDNEYYISIGYTNGEGSNYTVSSCGEALSLKDTLLRQSNVSSVTIRAKYRIHLYHDDCNKTYYKRTR